MSPPTQKAAEIDERSVAHDMDSVSEEMQQVRVAASALLNKAESASSVTDLATAVEKAAGALKLAAEMGKTRTELAKVNEEISKLKRENETSAKREGSERMRDYVALLTPLVTIITLAATLVAQNWQFLRSENDKREEALDARWNDAVKTISASGALSPGVIALQPFLRSTKYGEQAREVALNLLSSSSDPDFFTSLFSTALLPAGWDNLDRILRFARSLGARQNPLLVKTFDADKYINDLSRLTKDERSTYDYVNTVSPTVTAQVGSVLKTARPPGTHIDLSSAYFSTGDWQGIDFQDANLEGALLVNLDLQNAELKGVTKFTSADFANTAWWEVKSINKPFLDYLLAKYPVRPNNSYGPNNETVTQEAYDAATSRLKSQLK
jgi:hypothetical protein